MAEPGSDEESHFDPATYLDMILEEIPLYRVLQEQVTLAVEPTRARRVLELGTGTGETASCVLGVLNEATLVGLDESQAMLAEARRKLPRAELRVQRLQDPLPEGSFDLVFSALAVHHLDESEKADLFKRVSERLLPGGTFVLADLVVPVDPADVVVPVEDDYDKPSTVAEVLEWLNAASLEATVRWQEKDLAVISAVKPR